MRRSLGQIRRHLFEHGPVAEAVSGHVRAGVYVGDYSARVREYLWHQVSEGLGGEATASAVMCYRASNESGFEVRTLGKNRREPVLYDGLQLIAFKPVEEQSQAEAKDAPF